MVGRRWRYRRRRCRQRRRRRGDADICGIYGESLDLLPVFTDPGGGDGAPLEGGGRHGDGRGKLVVRIAHRDRDDSGPGLNRAGFFDVADVVGVLREAPDTVATHLGLALVWLEEPHPDVGFLGCLEEEDAVGADAESAE